MALWPLPTQRATNGSAAAMLARAHALALLGAPGRRMGGNPVWILCDGAYCLAVSLEPKRTAVHVTAGDDLPDPAGAG